MTLENGAKKIWEEKVEQIAYAYDRWLDENEYKDWKDYSNFLKKIAEECGCQFVKAHKRPFGMTFMSGDQKYQIKLTNKKIMLDLLE